MALSFIEKLHQKARNTSADDVKKLCSTIQDEFYNKDKSSECMALLRQLYFILQATDTEHSIPKDLLNILVSMVIQTDRTKVKECMLCKRILMELLPLDKKSEDVVEKFQDKVPCNTHLQLMKGKTGCLSKLIPTAVRWLQAHDMEYEVQRKAFSFLIAVSMMHDQNIDTDSVRSVNERFGNWLMDAGLYQAPNPYFSNPFRKDQNNLVTEVDGTPSTNFFTVLNIGQYYTDDQLLNIYTFSMLYQWISKTQDSLTYQREGSEPRPITLSGTRSDSPSASLISQSSLDKLGWSTSSDKLSRSPSSVPKFGRTPSSEKLGSSPAKPSLSPAQPGSSPAPHISSPARPGAGKQRSQTVVTSPQKSISGSQSRVKTPVFEQKSLPFDRRGSVVPKTIFDALVGRSMDYCFRLLDQCERKPKVSTDAELQGASLIETVRLLDLICKIDGSCIPKAFTELKRLSAQTAQDPNSPRILLTILQFLLDHCKAVAYDPQKEFSTMFHSVLSRHYNSHAVAFDIVLFILDNLEHLCYNFQILSVYFPNILKILAWNPRTFVCDFVEIIPAMMSETTSLEVFHTLIDLPCMTAALEVLEKYKNVDLSTLTALTSDLEPATSAEAFRNAMYRPMFNFFTRAEGGHGDTINRLGRFHAALSDMIEHPRVVCCCQAVPVLLRVWFSVIAEEGSSEFVAELVPVLLERTGLLFGVEGYKSDIRRIICENLTVLLKKYPEVVLRQQTDLMEFLANPHNIIHREDFFCVLIWAVGEFSSASYDNQCSADTVGNIYEVLEVLLYEVIGNTSATGSGKSMKVVSTLMSAIAKLASRCQDLIPRAILCLTKVAKQQQTQDMEPDTRDILLNRAQELINILKLPNFASVILNPPQHLETDSITEPQHDKTSKRRVPSKDSNQPAHPPSLISLHCALNGWLRTWGFFMWTAKTLVRLGGAHHFVGFVVLRSIFATGCPLINHFGTTR